MNSQASLPEIEYDNLLDYFQFYMLPLAIKIGMTPTQFWDDNPDDFFAYWDAYEMRKKDEAVEKNIDNYNLGKYFIFAIAQAFEGKRQVYPKQPFGLANNNKKVKMTQEEYTEYRKIKLKAMCERFNNNK